MAHSLHVCTHCIMCHGVWMSRGQSWFAPSVCGNPGIETRLLGLTASAFTHRVIILGTETDFYERENIFCLVPEIGLSQHFRAYHCDRTEASPLQGQAALQLTL